MLWGCTLAQARAQARDGGRKQMSKPMGLACRHHKLAVVLHFAAGQRVVMIETLESTGQSFARTSTVHNIAAGSEKQEAHRHALGSRVQQIRDVDLQDGVLLARLHLCSKMERASDLRHTACW